MINIDNFQEINIEKPNIAIATIQRNIKNTNLISFEVINENIWHPEILYKL